jgi:hypothetical protein
MISLDDVFLFIQTVTRFFPKKNPNQNEPLVFGNRTVTPHCRLTSSLYFKNTDERMDHKIAFYIAKMLLKIAENLRRWLEIKAKFEPLLVQTTFQKVAYSMASLKSQYQTTLSSPFTVHSVLLARPFLENARKYLSISWLNSPLRVISKASTPPSFPRRIIEPCETTSEVRHAFGWMGCAVLLKTNARPCIPTQWNRLRALNCRTGRMRRDTSNSGIDYS